MTEQERPLQSRLTDSRLAYSVRETAEILGISEISVYRLLNRGLLRASVALRHKRIPKSEIERFLNQTLGD